MCFVLLKKKRVSVGDGRRYYAACAQPAVATVSASEGAGMSAAAVEWGAAEASAAPAVATQRRPPPPPPRPASKGGSVT